MFSKKNEKILNAILFDLKKHLVKSTKFFNIFQFICFKNNIYIFKTDDIKTEYFLLKLKVKK